MTLKDFYNNTVKGELQKELGIKNIHAVPKIEKVVLNVGVGEASQNKKLIDQVVDELALISGQKPLVTHARKSVSAFKIRIGQPIGVKVTLRGKQMYIFLEKLFKVVLPRIRDFRGLRGTSFDKQGNLNIGITDQTLFPEIDYDKIDKIRGVEITIVTKGQSNEHARKLFEKMGVIFQSTDNQN